MRESPSRVPRQRVAPATASQTIDDPARMATALVDLQRLAGNKAVSELVGQSPKPPRGTGLVVQRGDPEATSPAATDEPTDDEIAVFEEGPEDERKRTEVTEMAEAEEDDLPALEAATDVVPPEIAEIEAELKSLGKTRDKATKLRRKQLKAELKDVKAAAKRSRTRLSVTRAVLKAKGSEAIREHLARASTNARDWFSNLIPSATFLGVEITPNQGEFKSLGLGGVHLVMYTRLKKAEDELTAELGLGAAEAGKALGLRGISGLRMPDKNKEGADLHSFGLAVDINGRTSNPYFQTDSPTHNLKFEAIRRASQLISGKVHDLAATPPKGTGATKIDKRVSQAEQMFDLITAVGGDLEKYFALRSATEVEIGGTTQSLEDLATRFATATGEPVKSVADWQAQISTDYGVLKSTYGKERDPAQASDLMDLDKRLVLALVRAGLAWGMYTKSKDIMHFDVRDSVIPYQRPNPNWH